MPESIYAYLQEFEGYYQHSNKKEIIQEKNIMIRKLIENQIKEKGVFHVNAPFGKRTCKDCGGTGEIYKFFRDVKTITCPKCNGRGNFVKPCLICQGSGRYIREELPLRINVKCKHCGGVGKIYCICPTCKGKGKVKKHVIAPKIKSTTLCPTCEGLGFYQDQKKSEHQFNPCVDRNSKIAEQLVQLIIPH